jgi:hypothetical protein
MSETAVWQRDHTSSKNSFAVVPAGIALVSFASLLLELSLTRLFSVVLFYHFAFLAISIALLGLGAGGVFAYVWKDWLAQWSLRRLGAAVCMIDAVAIVLVLEIVLHVPVYVFVEWHNLIRLTVMYLAAGVPFFFTGLLFSVVFAREARKITQLYSADLIGGAIACLAVVPLLNGVGAPNAIVLAAMVMATAAAVWSKPAVARAIAAGLASILLLLSFANHSGKLIDIVYAKGKRRDERWTLFSKWNAISRVEVDKAGDGRYIVIDADASTSIMSVDPAQWEHPESAASDAKKMDVGTGGHDWRKELMSGAPSVANVLRPKGTYAIIGPGGGVDVLRAVSNGSPSVTGIEINPIIANTIMRGIDADYSYHLYQLPQVHIHVGDGRSWIRTSRDKYDVVQMTLVDTWASTAAGAFALSENNLYTVQAFREYFDHLKPDGFIAITRWEFKDPREALRVVSQAIEALRLRGITDVRDHFIVVANGVLSDDGQPVLVLAKSTPFVPAETRAVVRHIAENPNLAAVYLPGSNHQGIGWAAPQAANAFQQLIAPQTQTGTATTIIDSRRDFIHGYAYNIASVGDNQPFFFFTFKTGQVLRRLVTHTSTGVDWKNNLGIAMLALVLFISILAVTSFLILPLGLRVGLGSRQVPQLLYFVAIGLGYIIVEIVLIQRFVLFLGHPTYALTVVVFLMLLSSGLGSLVSRRMLPRALDVRIVLATIVAATLLYIILLPRVLGALVGMAFPLKVLLSGIIVVPVAFAMGMPFPTGLRRISSSEEVFQAAQEFSGPAEAPSAVEWAWAMNAASTVLGSVLTMVLAIHFGLNVALACAAAAYLAALALTSTWTRGLQSG